MAKPGAKIRKIFRYASWIFLSLIFFIALSTTLLSETGTGQKTIGGFIGKFLTQKYHTRIEIGKFSVGISKISIKELNVYDKYDTLMFNFPEIIIRYNSLNQSSKNIKINLIELNKPIVNAVRHQRNELFNYEYLIKELFPKNSDSSESGRFNVSKIILRQGTVRYCEPQRVPNQGLMKYHDFFVTNVQIRLKNFHVKNGVIKTQIVALKAIDKSTFTIHQASGYLIVDDKQINLKNMALKASESEFYGSFGFFFNEYKDFSDFIPLIEIHTDLHDSRLSVNDLKYFAPKITTNVKNIFIEGNLKGTIDNFKGNDLVINYGNDFKYIGTAKIRGLPKLSETFIDLNAVSLYFSFNDLHALIPTLVFPEMLTKTGKLHFNGQYTGFVNDFVAYGTLNSGYGKIKTDLNLKIPDGGIALYSGNVNLTDFDLGNFLGNKQIGSTTLSGSVKGQGFSLDNINSNLEVTASHFEFNNYNYNNLKFSGIINKKMINGDFKVNDQNIGLNFNGSVDLGNEKPEYKFVASVVNANFHKLNFIKDDIKLTCYLDLNLKASTLDDIEGKVLVLNTHIETSNNQYDINTLYVQSRPFSGKKSIVFKSDVFEASIDGKFNYKELPEIFINTFAHYLDSSLIKTKTLSDNNQYINFDVQLFKTSLLNKLLKSYIVFEDNSKIKGNISHHDYSLRINANLPGFKYKDYYFYNLLLNLSTKGNILSAYSSFKQLDKKDTLMIENVNLSASSSSSRIDFTTYLFDKTFLNHINLNGSLKLTKDSVIALLENSYLTTLKNEKWLINSDSIFINFKPEIHISYLELKNNKRSVRAIGDISKSGDKPLRLIIDNTDFADISPYIPVNLSMFSGTLNGQMVIFNILGNAYFDAAISMNPLFYEEKTLGTLILTSSHSPVTLNTNVKGMLYSPSMDEIMHVNGDFDFIKKKTIDLTVEVPQTELKNFEPFVSFLASDISGEVNGQVRFTGPLNNYKINGNAYFSNAYFTIDYLKTRYHFTDYATLDENGIYLKNIIANDEFGNQATIFGKVNHRYFNDFFFNIGIIANNLHGLNTTIKDNTLYYGNAFASGRVDITGPLDNIKLDIQVKSEPNTKVSLCTFDDNTFGNYNYIRFTHGSSYYRNVDEDYSSGVVVNLDMEITPEADIEIIFDPITDDIIRAKGNGNLKLLVDEYGNNNMWGSIVIEEGTYTFSALIKRKLLVTKGSSITWKGDIYDAEAKIEAKYRVDASVYNLIKDNKNLLAEEKDLYRQTNFPVDAKLILTGNLFSPEVKLDFDILNTNSVTSGQQLIYLNQQIANIKSNEQELNKQVISLLLINSFLPPETGIGGISADNTFNANIGALFSNQWNQWLSGFSRHLNSKYINNIQLGVNYATEKQYQRELDVLMSGSLFNDRVEFTGSYDIQNVNANFQVNFKPARNSKLRVKVFNKSDNNIIQREDINRQGVGIFIKQDFDKWSELFRRKKKDLSIK